MKLQNSENLEICFDLKGDVFRWVVQNLNASPQNFSGQITLAVLFKGEVIAGIILSEIREGGNLWMSIFSCNRRWCSKRILKAVFSVAFDLLKCRRVSVRVDAANQKSKRLVEGLGFKKEGLLRGFEDNGHDSIIYSMFKKECQWR